MASSTERIRGFDALRAIAFLWVFISHQFPGFVTDKYGAAGVWLFFVLSGFLITRILAESRTAIEAGTSTVWGRLVDFYMKRTLRIVPVYYLFLGAMTLLAVMGLVWMGSPARQMTAWLFLYNIHVERHGFDDAVGHVWSLAVEEQFYLLFAPLALLTPRRKLWMPCLGLLALSVAAHVYYAGHVDLTGPTFDVDSLVNFGLLAIGGLAGLAANRPLPRWLSGDAATAAAMALVLLLPTTAPTMPDWIVFGRATGLVTGLLLIQIYQNQKGRVVGLLNWAPLRELGIVSYGAYLFQALGKSEAVLAAFGYPDAPKLVTFTLNLAITVGLALLSWRFFERPIRNLGRSRLFSRPATAST